MSRPHFSSIGGLATGSTAACAAGTPTPSDTLSGTISKSATTAAV